MGDHSGCPNQASRSETSVSLKLVRFLSLGLHIRLIHMLGSGKFTRLMNVIHSADHPLNTKRGVPDKYEQLELKEEADFTSSYLNYGPACSYSVKKVRTAGSLGGTTPSEW